MVMIERYTHTINKDFIPLTFICSLTVHYGRFTGCAPFLVGDSVVHAYRENVEFKLQANPFHVLYCWPQSQPTLSLSLLFYIIILLLVDKTFCECVCVLSLNIMNCVRCLDIKNVCIYMPLPHKPKIYSRFYIHFMLSLSSFSVRFPYIQVKESEAICKFKSKNKCLKQNYTLARNTLDNILCSYCVRPHTISRNKSLFNSISRITACLLVFLYCIVWYTCVDSSYIDCSLLIYSIDL